MDVADVQARGEKMGIRPRRQSISIGRHGRVWQDTTVGRLELGDIWLGVGKVIHVEYARQPFHVAVLAGDMKKPRVFDSHQKIRAFVKSE